MTKFVKAKDMYNADYWLNVDEIKLIEESTTRISILMKDDKEFYFNGTMDEFFKSMRGE